MQDDIQYLYSSPGRKKESLLSSSVHKSPLVPVITSLDSGHQKVNSSSLGLQLGGNDGLFDGEEDEEEEMEIKNGDVMTPQVSAFRFRPSVTSTIERRMEHSLVGRKENSEYNEPK